MANGSSAARRHKEYEPLHGLTRFRGGTRIRDRTLKIVDVGRRPRMYYWRGEDNFGDEMAPAIVHYVTGRMPVWVSSRYSGKLVAQGSVLDRTNKGDAVWGTGSIDGEPFDPPKGCHFLAVRGPLTRQSIRGEVPEIYGDPALLLPRLHNPAVEKCFDVGIVPHYVDREAMLSCRLDFDPRLRLIDVREPWREVVDAIRSCHRVVSSSLHGLIVAEAYGIPATWIRITDRVFGGSFKFKDYYLATGREEPTPTFWEAGISAAIARAAPPIAIDTDPLLESLRSASGLGLS